MEARQATTDDVDELIRLRQVMFDSMDGVMDTSSGWQEPCAEVFRRGIGDGSIGAFVVDAPEGDGLAACGVALVAARLPGPGNLTGRYGYVQSMATDERWRRRGFGRSVFGALVDWFRAEGVTAIDLHATDDGEALYRSFGFREGETVELRWRARWEHTPGRRLDQIR
jgi:GNAT superfamily N-acetyltransferase